MGNEIQIYGPPGTGKTSTIKKEIENIISSEGEQAAEQILISSFTVAAAKELGSRIVEVDDENIGTLHSFGYHQLGTPEVLGGKRAKKGVKDLTDEWNEENNQYGYAISRSDSYGADPDTYNDYATTGDELLAQCNFYRNSLVPFERWPLNYQSFFAKWKQFKNMHECIDFTDMIEKPYLENYGPPMAAQIGFFDEAQDFTPLMLARIRQMKEDMDLVVLAGDDDQAIYGFTGVNPSALIDEEDAIKEVLHQSYRLPKRIQQYSQKWIHQIRHRQPKDFEARQDGEIGGVHFRNWTYDRPEAMIHEIEGVIESGFSVMILTPNNFQTIPIVKALKGRGLPFHNPYRLRDGLWNPLRASRDGATSTGDRLGAFLAIWAPERLVAASQRGAPPVWTAGELLKWGELINTRGIMLNWSRSKEELSSQPFDAIIDPDEHLRDGQLEIIENGGMNWLLDNVKKDKEPIVGYIKAVIEKQGLEVLASNPQIIVGTIHSVKGGEADVVYLHPSLTRDQWSMMENDSDPFIRQFYVGMTRAKSELILCGYDRYGMRWIR